MTFLYFVVDVCFYNYTSFKTDFLLHALLEKKKNIWIYFGSILFIDFLLLAHGKLFLLYALLYFLNRRMKGSRENLKSVLARFLILYILYKMGVFFLFHTFAFEIFGFLITILVLCITHKKN